MYLYIYANFGRRGITNVQKAFKTLGIVGDKNDWTWRENFSKIFQVRIALGEIMKKDGAF